MSERWKVCSTSACCHGFGGRSRVAILRLLNLRGIPHLAPARSQCDLLDAGAVRSTWEDFKPTVVLHLAGWVAGVQGNLSFAGRAFYENTCIM